MPKKKWSRFPILDTESNVFRRVNFVNSAYSFKAGAYCVINR